MEFIIFIKYINTGSDIPIFFSINRNKKSGKERKIKEIRKIIYINLYRICFFLWYIFIINLYMAKIFCNQIIYLSVKIKY
jgi:hypothetical protein